MLLMVIVSQLHQTQHKVELQTTSNQLSWLGILHDGDQVLQLDDVRPTAPLPALSGQATHFREFDVSLLPDHPEGQRGGGGGGQTQHERLGAARTQARRGYLPRKREKSTSCFGAVK